jgi:integrase
VLRRELTGLATVVRAKPSLRLPVVLSREEVAAILSRMAKEPRLMATLMYGSGLRLLECCQLRGKDLDFSRREITVRDGKGRKDRVTLLPDRLSGPLQQHLARVRYQHGQDPGRLPYGRAPRCPRSQVPLGRA